MLLFTTLTDGRIIRSERVSDSTVTFLHIPTLYASAWHPPRVRIDITDSSMSVVAGICVQDHSNASEALSKSHLQHVTLRCKHLTRGQKMTMFVHHTRLKWSFWNKRLGCMMNVTQPLLNYCHSSLSSSGKCGYGSSVGVCKMMGEVL